jgi:hypothetical protein
LEEAKKINKSLSALGMVINALTDGKVWHLTHHPELSILFPKICPADFLIVENPSSRLTFLIEIRS